MKNGEGQNPPARVSFADAMIERLRHNLQDPRQRAMGVSLAASLLMLAGKLAAYALTGSAAIFSDAAESVVHIVATLFVSFGLWYALQPPDAQHLYGHGKMAYLTAAVEGTFILAAGLSILYTGVRALIDGVELRQLGAGLLLIAGLAAVNLVLGLYLKRQGRRHNSLVLISNGEHVLADMWTSLGVVAGVALAWLTGLLWLDAALAIAVALHVLWTSAQLFRRAYEGLMEKADAADTRAILAELERAVEAGRISGFHQLRHRRVNDRRWVEVHLLFPDDLQLTDAHARANAVEEALQRLFPEDEVHVTAHLEPEAHDDHHPDGHSEPVDPLMAG